MKGKQYTAEEFEEIQKILAFEMTQEGVVYDLTSKTPILDNLIEQVKEIDPFEAAVIIDIKNINYEDENYEDAVYQGYRWSPTSGDRSEWFTYSILEIDFVLSPTNGKAVEVIA